MGDCQRRPSDRPSIYSRHRAHTDVKWVNHKFLAETTPSNNNVLRIWRFGNLIRYSAIERGCLKYGSRFYESQRQLGCWSSDRDELDIPFVSDVYFFVLVCVRYWFVCMFLFPSSRVLAYDTNDMVEFAENNLFWRHHLGWGVSSTSPSMCLHACVGLSIRW